MENSICPITALSFCQLDRLYIVAGKAQCVTIFDHRDKKLVAQRKIFDSETVHGIFIQRLSLDDVPDRSSILLVWGGRSICVLQLDTGKLKTNHGTLSVKLLVPELSIDGWILNGRLELDTGKQGRSQAAGEAFLVTTYNELIRICLDASTISSKCPFVRTIGVGPRCLLYSAHLISLQEGSLLVAAGTIFGKVLLWSMNKDVNGHFGSAPELHYELDGHQGSIFGVRISDELTFMDGRITRLLASCSDDRTICVWDITERGLDHQKELQDRLVASTMGHASRIWDVQFLESTDDSVKIMSTGEDSTLQAWNIKVNGPKNGAEALFWKVSHDATYSFHSGKHMWASAFHKLSSDLYLVATAGADGRIASYTIQSSSPSKSDNVLDFQFTIGQVSDALDQEDSRSTRLSKSKEVLSKMEGTWDISRQIRSSNPSYPSGTLSGSATVEKRKVTDDTFNDEYLYTEHGNFVTEQGLTMKASRQYVYRYQLETDECSAWFVKADDSAAVDYLFHKMMFHPGADQEAPNSPKVMPTISAKGYHLCVQDDYNAEYTFHQEGRSLKRWEVRYIVKGPAKDYVADASYSRPLLKNGFSHERVSSDEDSYIEPKSERIHLSRADAFKSYAWMNHQQFLATTEKGKILIGTLTGQHALDRKSNGMESQSIMWTLAGSLEDLQSASIVAAIPSLNVAFLIGSTGKVHLYDGVHKKLLSLHNGGQKAIFSAAQRVLPSSPRNTTQGELDKAQEHTLALATTSFGKSDADVSIHSYVKSSLRLIIRRTLYLPQYFVVTSFYFLSELNLILFGFRYGNLALYDLNQSVTHDEPIKPLQVMPRLHEDAVTCIVRIPCAKQQPDDIAFIFLTTGRDGRYCIQRISRPSEYRENSSFEIESLHESILPFGPNIEGAHFEEGTQDLYLWGFRGTQFVVWNEKLKVEVMAVECGGSHRSWSYIPSDFGGGGGSFIWTKASVCKVSAQSRASHDIIQRGGHGREIKALAISPLLPYAGGSKTLVATGAEDTTIRIFEYGQESGFSCLRILKNHSTGVQKLEWSEDGVFLFSSAGCEEFYAWRVSHIPGFGLGTVCVARCPKVTEDGDLRIIDFVVIRKEGPKNDKIIDQHPGFLIFMVYSDSSVRIYNLESLDGIYEFHLSSQGRYSRSCLTQASSLDLKSVSYLCTASTDGHLAFWCFSGLKFDRVPPALSEGSLPIKNGEYEVHSPISLRWNDRIQVHQSGILSSFYHPVSFDELLIVTGGDDQALAVTHIKTSDPTFLRHKISARSKILTRSAHLSAVTSIAFLQDYTVDAQSKIILFASVGSDQRLKTWRLEFEQKREDSGLSDFGNLRLTAIDNQHTAIADASSLRSFIDRQGVVRICVAGVGVECWRVKNGRLASNEA